MGKFTAFKVPLKSLTEGVHNFNFHLDKEFFVNMESVDIHNADVDVALAVNVMHEIFSFDFKFTGNVTVLCDRCLDDLIFPIDTTYQISVKYGDDYNDDSDELLEIPWSDNDINVAYMIYDTVSLAIPIKRVHAPGKCNRTMSEILHKHTATLSDDEFEQSLIDSVDGMDGSSDTPTDPRWDALKALSENNDD